MSDARSSTPLRAPLALGAMLLLAACSGLIGDRAVDDAPVALDPAPSTLHRLTQAQYTNALHDLLGAAVVVPAALEPDLAVGGFYTVGGSVGSVSARGIEEYEAAAFQVAGQALTAGPARDALVGCTPTGNADAIDHVSNGASRPNLHRRGS